MHIVILLEPNIFTLGTALQPIAVYDGSDLNAPSTYLPKVS